MHWLNSANGFLQGFLNTPVFLNTVVVVEVSVSDVVLRSHYNIVAKTENSMDLQSLALKKIAHT